MTTTTNFVWDSVSDCVLSELDGNNAVLAVYTNEPQQFGGVLSQRRGTTTSTLHADALGTTRALTSSTQTTTDTYLYDAWGNLVASSGTTVNPFRWVGRYGYYQDSSTGLVYVWARMYQPTVARWMSVDPIGFSDDVNQFRYAHASAVMYIDPSGNAGEFGVVCTNAGALCWPQYLCGHDCPEIWNLPQLQIITFTKPCGIFVCYFTCEEFRELVEHAGLNPYGPGHPGGPGGPIA